MRSGWRIGAAEICLIVADSIAFALLGVALIVAKFHRGNSPALLIGIPPLVLAAVVSLAFVVARLLNAKVPLIVGMVICVIGLLAAMTSFITPLLAAAVPIGFLLIVACAVKLASIDAARAGQRAGQPVPPR